MSDARGLILLRTHFVDAGIAELARSYAAGGDYDVMIALDETAGEIDAHGCPKLSMSLNSCVRLGLNVAFEAPLSGFGMNPARTLSSALPSGTWTSFWIYLSVPPLAMVLAAQAYVGVRGNAAVRCCKLHHRSDRPCIFCGAKVTPEF